MDKISIPAQVKQFPGNDEMMQEATVLELLPFDVQPCAPPIYQDVFHVGHARGPT